ncbi:MAG: hypothetical protein WA419_07665 [Silvibacterium sp.]
MHDITEHTLLSRATVVLPDKFRITTEDFREGWKFVLSGDVHWIGKKIRKRGWHFIWIAEPSLRSGLGQTAQAAIAGALKLALRHVSQDFNAANIDHIHLTKYPWFFIARVRVYPYQIQQNAVLSISSGATPVLAAALPEVIAIPGIVAAPAA